MRVLVVGGGGREHALVRGLCADATVTEVFAAPGNPGIAALARLVPLSIMDSAAVAEAAASLAVDLVVVGPEAPLVAGVADAVRSAGFACFGPSAAAARLEGSKAFAKEVMRAAGVPTAESLVCVTGAEVAAALERFGPPYVVKDDALAAGKGVVVTDSFDAAMAHAARCGRVVVEEYLDGPEVSLFVVCDGSTAVPLLPAQDFKRVGDGDTGPNTGGMGAYAPLPWLPESTVEHVMATVVSPTLSELAARDTPFTGLLYVGLALTTAGPRVVEFNVRFGDPEAEAVLALLASPLGQLLYAAATGALDTHPELCWHRGAAVTVVVAAPGYPDSPRLGGPITGADAPGVFHAGTAVDGDGQLRAAGGRVLACTATGPDVAAARAAAYALIDGVTLPEAQYRTDIAAGV
jgi:phosphoribosylamine--glycine ligase